MVTANYYVVHMVEYANKDHRIIHGTRYDTLDKARRMAYKLVAHEGDNARGRYFCEIFGDTKDGFVKFGEVMNDVFDVRRWYPNRKVSSAKYRKYRLYKDGTTSKGLSW